MSWDEIKKNIEENNGRYMPTIPKNVAPVKYVENKQETGMNDFLGELFNRGKKLAFNSLKTTAVNQITNPRKSNFIDELKKNAQDNFLSYMTGEKEKQLSEDGKNKNILEDAGSLANLYGLGVSTGNKEALNFIETGNENTFQGYKNLKERQFLTSPKVSEENKAIAKIQDNLLLNSKGIKIDDENKIETNLVKKAIRDSINEDNKKIQEEQQKINDEAMKTLGEIAPSMGQQLTGMALSTVNPILGTGYFYTSAGGSYIEDGLQRGMSEKQAWKYGNIMAALESASESVITGQQLGKVSKAFSGKEISKKLLNSYGFNIFENAVQEAVMEPAQELTAQIIAGNDKADWTNMVDRILKSGFNGGLMGGISNGVTYGLEKSGNVYNKIKNGESITQTEYKEALQENIDTFGRETVEKAIKNGATEVYQEINNLQQQSTQSQPVTPMNTQKLLDDEINTAIQDNTSKGKVTLGRVTDNIATKVKSLLGIDVTNRTHVLADNDIRHMLNEHGDPQVESRKGQIAITQKDISKIPDIINNYDDIVKGNPNKNGDTIRYIKSFGDGTTYLVEVVPEKSKTLNIKTMWKKPTSLANQLEPSLTSKTQSRSISSTSNNSIPPINSNVNESTITNNYAQSNENNTQNEIIPPTKGETIDWNEMERPEGKIRKHYRSIIESSNTTKEAKAIAKDMMGLDTYTPQSNESLLQKADSRINASNPETELNSLLSRAMNNEKVNDVDMAVGERLIEYYSKIGDSQHLQDAIHATALAGTQAGRTVQAMALLNHMTPQGQVVWLQRSIEKANKELQQRFKNKKNIPQFELTSEMTDKLLKTQSKEEMYKVLDEIYEELGQQVPKTTLEKIDEWRYFSMLANVKTHARNIIGNIAMGGVQRIKNKAAGVIEGTVAKFNPEMERTHTIVPTSKKVKEFAKNDVLNMDVQTELGMNENKYNPQSRLQSARRTFKSNILENTLGKMFDLNSKLLEIEDNIGLKSMYVKSLGEYITANKIDIENITDAQLSKARQHAIKEAQEATFHQASAIATWLNQAGRKNNIAKFALDSSVPFKKTPINVVKAGVQYSPVGLVKHSLFDIGKVRRGDISVNQYIDNVSKGLTGTGITFLGYALAEAGILKASGGDDDKKEQYDEEQGKQSYAIEIGGKTYSLDWLSPVGIPLFIGAEINQQFNTAKKEKNSKSNDDNEILNQAIKRATNISNAFANAINPMSEMSMISGLTSVLSSYNKENAIGDMFVNAGKSYINQFVPTALGQLARTTDNYERTTKSTKTGTLEKAVDSTINQIKSKIPGLRQTLPVKTDIWGKEIKQDPNIPFRAFNNFINPSTVKDVSADKVDKELNSLYAKTGESSVIPKAIEKKYTINGTDYTMTNKEYAKYYKNYGETSYNLIKNLISSKDYKNLTDKQKQKAIEEIYSYAKEKNKIDYAKANRIKVEKNSTIYDTLEALKENKGSQSSYLSYLVKTNEIEGEDANKKKIEVLNNSGYSNKTKSIIYENTLGKKDTVYSNLKKLTNVNIDAYLDYKLQETKGDEDTKSNVQGKTVSGSKKEKVRQYLANSNLSDIEKVYLYGKSYKLANSDRNILIQYMNNLTNEELIDICKDLTPNFELHKDGNYYWK